LVVCGGAEVGGAIFWSTVGLVPLEPPVHQNWTVLQFLTKSKI
jgi:hypothetical protein